MTMRIQKALTDTLRGETRPLSLCARVNTLLSRLDLKLYPLRTSCLLFRPLSILP